MRQTTRVGCDIVCVADVEASILQFGDRYLRRVYTPAELETCSGADRPIRLSARFAAKEALVKVLRAHDQAVPWTSIEVRRQPGGWCSIVLTGNAKMIAAHENLDNFEVSLSHEANMAMAVVIASRTISRDETATNPSYKNAYQGFVTVTNEALSTIREVLDKHGNLQSSASDLGRLDDLYEAGLTSHSSVNVMLALEDAFDLEFPDELLRKSTFASIDAIGSAIATLQAAA